MAEQEQILASEPKRAPPAQPGRPALRADLLQMADQDQKARQLLINEMKDGQDLPDDALVTAVDAGNLRRLKSIVSQDGLPTSDMVGVDGVQATFLLIAHAETDLAFQERMLKLFSERLGSGEIKGSQFALLTDKVLRGQDKPQLYGTQFEPSGNEWKPQPIADEAHVDQRRHALGMVSMADYTCQIRAVYGAPPPVNAR